MAQGRKGKAKAKSKKSSSDEPIPDAPFCKAWVWWSASADAPRKPPKDDFDKKIPTDIQSEFHVLMKAYRDRVGDLKVGLHYSYIGDDIWELRLTRHNNPYRLLFFRWGNRAIALDVFHKTTQKTPKERALNRKAKWLATRGDTPPV